MSQEETPTLADLQALFAKVRPHIPDAIIIHIPTHKGEPMYTTGTEIAKAVNVAESTVVSLSPEKVLELRAWQKEKAPGGTLAIHSEFLGDGGKGPFAIATGEPWHSYFRDLGEEIAAEAAAQAPEHRYYALVLKVPASTRRSTITQASVDAFGPFNVNGPYRLIEITKDAANSIW